MKERNFDSIQLVDLAENSIQLSLVSCSIWVDYTWMNIRASRKQILKMIAHC